MKLRMNEMKLKDWKKELIAMISSNFNNKMFWL